MTYQEWGFIADCYIPVLSIIFFISAFKTGSNKGTRSQIIEVLGVLLSILFIYGLMFIDNTFKIWSRLGLDYSTHTALSLVFVTYFSLRDKRQRLIAILSILLYMILMNYQQYHSTMDMLTTSIIVLPTLYLLQSKANNISSKMKK